MSLGAHTYVVGEVLLAATCNTYIRDNLDDLDSRLISGKVGTYTGDGAESQPITGVGFTPIYVRIWTRQTSDGGAVDSWETSTTIIDDHASKGTVTDSGVPASGLLFYANRIISLDADGFTVDDDAGDEDPNKNGIVYNYLAIGA